MLQEVDGLALTKLSSASRSHKLPNAEFWVDMKLGSLHPEPQARSPLPPHKMKLRRKINAWMGGSFDFLLLLLQLQTLLVDPYFAIHDSSAHVDRSLLYVTLLLPVISAVAGRNERLRCATTVLSTLLVHFAVPLERSRIVHFHVRKGVLRHHNLG